MPKFLLSNDFNKIANILLNKIHICTPKNAYQIVEIEFYYYDKINHPDPFVHCDDDQKIPNKWYFHKQNMKNYKEGTYKGVDITFGKLDNQYGGILIRSIKDINTHELIEGSCLTMNRFLQDNEVETVSHFVKLFDDLEIRYKEKFLKKNYYRKCPLYLEKIHSMKNNIYTGPRVGLTLKKNDGDRIGYIAKKYRYFTNTKLKKFKCGIILSLWHQGYFMEQISDLTGTHKRYIKKYISLYADNDIQKINTKKNENQ